MAETKTITPAEFAEMVDSDGRTVRKFLRATRPDDAPGKGARWQLKGTKAEVTKLEKAFREWHSAQEAKAKADADKKAEEADVEIEESDEE
jgi:hypothetical protein